jgi:dipeptidyl aminopeptidase/acylaminoacyl peptidase
MERNINIESGNWKLAATLHYPKLSDEEEKQGDRIPIVIICHGFVGNRIGTDRLFVKAARELSANGYMVLRFDYAGSGESYGDYGQEGLDSMIEQTRIVLDYMSDIEGTDPERVTLLGHSLGGAVSILTAAKDKRVTNLVLWASVAHPLSDILSITGEQVYENAQKQGYGEYLGYRLTSSFFESLTKYHPLREINHFSGDVLLIHGTSDDVIPADYSFLYQKLFWTRLGGECDKEIIMHANHTFSSESSAQAAILRTKSWLQDLDRKKKEWYGWTI